MPILRISSNRLSEFIAEGRVQGNAMFDEPLTRAWGDDTWVGAYGDCIPERYAGGVVHADHRLPLPYPPEGTPMTYDTHHDTMWADLPLDIKHRARAILQAFYEPSLFAQIRRLHADDPTSWCVGHHFFWGMGVRNLLRSGQSPSKDTLLAGIPDEKLPSGNWDDYYVAALEYAAGIRGE